MLPTFGIGLTDLAKKHAGTELPHTRRRIRHRRVHAAHPGRRPQSRGFQWQEAVAIFFGRKTADISFGLRDERIGTSAIFVLPSTSGTACSYWKPEYWAGIARFAGLRQSGS